MTSRLLLVRHGPIGAEYQGRFVGATDPPLDEGGRPQLVALARRLEGYRPQRCYCSPRLRCRQTALALFTTLAERGLEEGLAIRFDADLREIDFGHWEQRTFAEIARDEPALVDRWAALAPDFAFPGGESLASFLDRVRRAADRLVHEEVETVLVITHGGVIRAMLCHLLGLEPHRYLDFDIGYASLTVWDCGLRIADSIQTVD